MKDLCSQHLARQMHLRCFSRILDALQSVARNSRCFTISGAGSSMLHNQWRGSLDTLRSVTRDSRCFTIGDAGWHEAFRALPPPDSAPCPHHAVEYVPFIKRQLTWIQSTLGPDVMQIWSRNPPKFGGPEIFVVHRVGRPTVRVRNVQALGFKESLRVTLYRGTSLIRNRPPPRITIGA